MLKLQRDFMEHVRTESIITCFLPVEIDTYEYLLEKLDKLISDYKSDSNGVYIEYEIKEKILKQIDTDFTDLKKKIEMYNKIDRKIDRLKCIIHIMSPHGFVSSANIIDGIKILSLILSREKLICEYLYRKHTYDGRHQADKIFKNLRRELERDNTNKYMQEKIDGLMTNLLEIDLREENIDKLISNLYEIESQKDYIKLT